MAAARLNKNNSAVKRIMQEAKELANDPCTDYSAAPLEDDIFEWHCTLRGPSGTEFEGGLYHFRILLPAEYPFRPPSIMILTPNGRFELNTKICISFTNYHEELWQPAWGVRTAIIGLQGFFPLKGQAAVGVGSIEYPASERKRLATLSREWTCPHCKQTNLELLPDPPSQPEVVPAINPSDIPAQSTSPVSTSSTSPPSSDTSEDEPVVVHEVNAFMPSGGATGPSTPSPAFIARAPRDSTLVGAPPTDEATPTASGPRRSPQRPPLLLDTAICVLLVLVFALLCRRIF
ncbi:hypothetical protein ONZ45_g5271 [Pleurotus djamor]|nr:hypothetical protein ONZ45_g5271 [Pleurotus djamor]